MIFKKAFFATAKGVKRVYIWQLNAWPAFTWNDAPVLQALLLAHQAQARLLGALQSGGMDGLQGVSRVSWFQETLATAPLEGQSLDLGAVRSSVGFRLGLAVPPTKDREVEGLVQVMQEAVEHHHLALTDRRLCAWQKMLFPANAEKPAKLRIEVGSFRTHEQPMQIVSGAVGKEVVHCTAPPSEQVPQRMAQLLYWLEATRPPATSGTSTGIFRPPGLGARPLHICGLRRCTRLKTAMAALASRWLILFWHKS